MQLSRLLKILRAHGVTSYADAAGLSITFGLSPVQAAPKAERLDDEKPKDPPLPGDAVALALHLGTR